MKRASRSFPVPLSPSKRTTLSVAAACSAFWIAERMASVRDDGRAALVFLIGGPDGHGDEVLRSADLSLSLGRMTLPHGLARVVLAEQIYRAVTILAGHPYHRS